MHSRRNDQRVCNCSWQRSRRQAHHPRAITRMPGSKRSAAHQDQTGKNDGLVLLHRARFIEWQPAPIVALASSHDGSLAVAARETGDIELYDTSSWHSFQVGGLGGGGKGFYAPTGCPSPLPACNGGCTEVRQAHLKLTPLLYSWRCCADAARQRLCCDQLPGGGGRGGRRGVPPLLSGAGRRHPRAGQCFWGWRLVLEEFPSYVSNLVLMRAGWHDPQAGQCC